MDDDNKNNNNNNLVHVYRHICAWRAGLPKEAGRADQTAERLYYLTSTGVDYGVAQLATVYRMRSASFGGTSNS